jgi:DNA-directed RNA polymerase specialized sigma24 family protein
MSKRRVVTDAEFNKALYGVPGDEQSIRDASNNRNILKSVSSSYRRFLSQDVLLGCELHALWRTLQYHRDEYGQKFTTSLYRFAHWQCRCEIRKLCFFLQQRNKAGCRLPVLMVERDNLVDNIRDAITCLKHEWMRSIIVDYYFFGYSLRQIAVRNGLCYEGTRKRLRLAERELGKILAD